MPSSRNPNTVVQPGSGSSGSGSSSAVLASTEGLSAHITTPANAHPAQAIPYAGGTAWADGETNPAATAEEQFDKIIANLISTTATHSGAHRVGSAQLAATNGAGVTSSGTIFSQLQDLKNGANIGAGARSSWVDGTTNTSTDLVAAVAKIITDLIATAGSARVNSAALPTWPDTTQITADSIFNQLTALVNGLASTTVSSSGADKVRSSALSNWADGTTNPAGTVRSLLEGIITGLAVTTADHSGAHRINTAARTNWLDGTTNPAATSYAAQDKIITDLSSTTSSADGAVKIGAQTVVGSYAAMTIRGQLDEIISGTQAVTGAKTFSNLTMSGTNRVKLASRSITRTQEGTWQTQTGTVALSVNNTVILGTTGARVVIGVHVPDNCTITGYSVTLTQTGTPHSSLPAVPGAMKLVEITTSGTSVLDTTSDASGSIGAIDANHAVTKSGLSVTVDRTAKRYAILFTAESGANSQSGQELFNPKVTYTMTEMDEG